MPAEDRRVKELAEKLRADGDPCAPDMKAALIAARTMIEDSDARTQDPEAGLPSEEEVIHRTSREATETGGLGDPAAG